MCRSGKVEYATAASAYKMIGKKGQRLRAYKCPLCHQYHTTSHAEPPTTKDYRRRKMELRAA